MINSHTRDQRVILAGTTVVELTAEHRMTLLLTGNRRKLVERVEARWQRTLDQILDRPSMYLSNMTWSGRNVLKDSSIGAEWSESYPRPAHGHSQTIVHLRTIEDILAIQVQKDQQAAVQALKARMGTL